MFFSTLLPFGKNHQKSTSIFLTQNCEKLKCNYFKKFSFNLFILKIHKKKQTLHPPPLPNLIRLQVLSVFEKDIIIITLNPKASESISNNAA